jgi:hypothetical protein
MANSFYLPSVISAVERSIKAILDERNKRAEAYLNTFICPRHKYWFFGPLVTPTRAQAIRKIENDIYHSCIMDTLQEFGMNRVTRLNKLLLFARALESRCGTEITLSIDEFADIADSYEAD